MSNIIRIMRNPAVKFHQPVYRPSTTSPFQLPRLRKEIPEQPVIEGVPPIQAAPEGKRT